MVKLAFVGTGHIHTPDFIKKIQERDGDSVVYIYDHNEERAKKDAAELGAEVVGLERILSDETIDAVVVCCETNRHKDVVPKIAEAGKALFVEKPLGMNARDASSMADTIEQAGGLFQTGFFMRGNGQLLFLKKQIANGAFGEITRIRLSCCHRGALAGWFDTDWRWMADIEQAGCGGFGDLGFHVIDIMMWLLGAVDEVTATIKSVVNKYENCDETGEGLLRFASGAMGSVTAGWVDVADPVFLQIAGTKGHAIIFRDELYFQSEVVDGYDGQSPVKDLPANLPHAFELFLAHLSGDTKHPLVGVREAAKVCSVVEAFYQSAKENRWVKPT